MKCERRREQERDDRGRIGFLFLSCFFLTISTALTLDFGLDAQRTLRGDPPLLRFVIGVAKDVAMVDPI
jgi:hypothetical protein